MGSERTGQCRNRRLSLRRNCRQFIRAKFCSKTCRDAKISINGLARAIGVPPNRVSQIVNGKRDITADTAVRLARYFGTSPQYWLNMQIHYELRRIDQEAIARAVTPLQREKWRKTDAPRDILPPE